jgi:glycosyltransferase involved in cell wall biosynthesis
VIPNGADPARFDPVRATPLAVRERHGLGTSFVVGWTGVIREWHGLELLLDALTELDDARLLVVGDGPGRAAVHARATSLGLADRITITGRIPHEDVPDHIAAMDVAVVASDRTGVASPMKLAEYMAMGRAVVAPALPNIEDVITHGADGWLFRPDDVVDLVRVLKTLSGDEGLRLRLGDMARRTVVERRNWRSIAARALNALSEVVRVQARERIVPDSSNNSGTLLRSSSSDEKYPLGPRALGNDEDVV